MYSVDNPSSSVDNPAKRRKHGIPVVIVEDHNEVLPHLYRAIGSKKLLFENGVILHFDSHPDLMIPANLDAGRIRDKDYVLNSLSIENWILPAVYAKHFTTIAWIKPPWATQLDEGIHHFKIGRHQTSKEIKVTCSQSYFVSELSWCSEDELEEAHEVFLEVCTLDGSDDKESETKPSFISPELVERLNNCPYVLDIDLDFYSTKNPFLSMFTEKEFEVLRDLFHYEQPENNSDQALRQATIRRQVQLSNLRSVLTPHPANTASLSSQETKEEEQEEEEETTAEAVRGRTLRKKAKALMASYTGDADILFDAGCTCDDCDLPHHVSTHDEVHRLVAATTAFLSSLPKPAIITIARSSRDDYCPPEDVDFIQTLVLRMLESVYGETLVYHDYEREVKPDCSP